MMVAKDSRTQAGGSAEHKASSLKVTELQLAGPEAPLEFLA